MNGFVTGRRAWLAQAAAFATTGIVTSSARWSRAADKAAASDAAGQGEAVLLTADPNKSLLRVRVEVEVQGQVNVPKNALVSREKATQYPLRAKSVMDWEERLLGVADDRTASLAERYFHEGRIEGTSGKHSQRDQLRETSRYLRVTRQDSQWVTYSPDSYLSGTELELLEMPASSLAVDALMPLTAVHQGETYQPSRPVLAKLLSLASVDDSDVTAEVNEIAADMVKIHLKGKVLGSVAGVPTTIDLVGKLVFDRRERICNWLALAVREQREIGKSEPGFDVAATIKMVRKPLAVPTRLSSIPPASLTQTVPADRLYCELSSRAVGFTFLMDRRWKMMSDAAGASMIRMIENDRGIAQCDVRPTGAMAAGTQLTMAAFIADVKQSLGNRFGQLIESHEDVNEFGLRVLRVSTQGLVEGVPVQWVFLHFSDDAGRRMLATMTVGGSELDAFAGAEVQLGASMQFTPIEHESPEVATAEVQPAIKK